MEQLQEKLQTFIMNKKQNNLDVKYAIVSEIGASVYSASK